MSIEQTQSAQDIVDVYVAAEAQGLQTVNERATFLDKLNAALVGQKSVSNAFCEAALQVAKRVHDAYDPSKATADEDNLTNWAATVVESTLKFRTGQIYMREHLVKEIQESANRILAALPEEGAARDGQNNLRNWLKANNELITLNRNGDTFEGKAPAKPSSPLNELTAQLAALTS
jgi:hypothetical protein